MVKTIEQQTGWKRPHLKTICQDTRVLMEVYEYDFQLENLEFLNYFIARTGIHLGSEEKPDLKTWLLTSSNAENWLRNSQDYKYLLNDETVQLGKKRESAITTNKILKGRIQDCWELFKSLDGSSIQ